MNKPIMLSQKRVEEARSEYLGTKNTPSSIEIALAMRPVLQKKAELQVRIIFCKRIKTYILKIIFNSFFVFLNFIIVLAVTKSNAES